jgi:PD-(D/E)XK nuclease superfamily protein
VVLGVSYVVPWWSPSKFACYEQCPAEFYQRYVLGEPIEPNVPMWFGTAVHKGLEAHYRGEDGELAFRRKWRECIPQLRAIGCIVPDSLFEIGLLCIEQVAALELVGEPERRIWIRTEAYLNAPLLGYADLWSADTHTIYDFKTTLGSWGQARAEREIWQPGLYSYAYWIETEVLPAFEYIVLNRGTGELQRFRTQRSHEQISDMLTRARQIAVDVAAENWTCTCQKHLEPAA